MMSQLQFLAVRTRKTPRQKQVVQLLKRWWLCCCRRRRRVYWLLSRQRSGGSRQPTIFYFSPLWIHSPIRLPTHQSRFFNLPKNLPACCSNLLCRKLRAIHAGLHRLSPRSTWWHLLGERSFPEADWRIQPVGPPAGPILQSGKGQRGEDYLGLSFWWWAKLTISEITNTA